MTTTLVAPREITDLVYRACRVGGVDAGRSRRAAINVTHAEIHRGCGVAAFLIAADEGATAVAEFATAADEIEAAEIDQRSAEFVKAVSLAAISASLWDAGSRGYLATSCSDVAGDHVGAIDFVSSGFSGERVVQAREREQAAMQDGVALESRLLHRLTDVAAAFLVDERIVDDATL